MPILTATDPPRKRRTPVWALVLAVVVFPFAGLFAWSWFQPVTLFYGTRGIGFGRVTAWQLGGVPRPRQRWVGERIPGGAWGAFRLPGGQNAHWYGGGWMWR